MGDHAIAQIEDWFSRCELDAAQFANGSIGPPLHQLVFFCLVPRLPEHLMTIVHHFVVVDVVDHAHSLDFAIVVLLRFGVDGSPDRILS